ncbi:protein phosphatase 2C domain-containing protein [Streptomyces sp. NBC_00555]|uniref:protein phosphatase 2C domain-containing protein n=1 Tax=Streptomyces sp. NBC_00555 TaxID=2903662 RepID=UPI0022529F51|nr:protein phosphatase 2C domain-containing protein [Streptomyces sp. NBC_00555]MCX5013896.1 protein phosphatase 2C domain-containing protein [Streptomyces sp. NBC_00555]
MSMHRPSGCPSCAEPLEEGDRFCGVCGYAVSAAAPVSPATPAGGPPAPPAPGSEAPVPWGSPRTESGGGHPGQEPDHPTIPLPTAPPSGSSGGYGAAGTAPGWGSSATAAPTLVDAPAEARYDVPGGAGTPPEETPWDAGEAPYGISPQAADGPSARYDLPGGTGGTPPEGNPWGAGDGGTTPEDIPAEAPQGTGGKTCVACRTGYVDTDGYCEHCGHAQPRERDHLEEELGSVAAVSDRGLRHHRNEDAFAVAATALPDGSAATVAIVCDGVSSASRPDEASAAAAAAANEALLDALPRGAHPQEAMHEAILAAAAAVNALAPETPGAQNAPACTLVGAVVSGGLLTIGWVGDSRAYWVPDDRAALPRRLTEDDSWAAQMVAAGLMGEAEAYADVRAHAITGWLGADAYDLEPHTAVFKPDHPGVVVVCTDGLWNYAEAARDLAQVLPPDAAVRPLHSAQVLVGHALDGGGHDNVTVAVVPFAAQPEPEPGTEPEPGAGPGAEPEASPRA